MSNVKMLSVAMLLLALSTSGSLARAADPAAMATEVIQYRLEKWKTAHADGEKQTKQLAATLKKLKCEVKLASHGGHSDVNYRCPKWQQLALKSHKLAHQWESWLKKYGFETKHTH